MLEGELLKSLPNGGAVVALIVVVILFLKKQDRTDAMYTSAVAADRQAFQNQLAGLMERSDTSQRLYMEQIKSLVGDYTLLTRENITAVRSLDATVRELQTVVRRDAGKAGRPQPPKESP